MKYKHGLLFFISSCIPGCGQMHQGYMKRGISILSACSILFVLALSLYMEALFLLLVPICLASFFDSYDLRTRLENGTAPEDAFLFGLSDLDAQKLSALCGKRHSLIGWLLVAVGVYMLFETVVKRVMNAICDYLGQWWMYDIVVRDLPRLAITVGIIALGIWFIRGPKQPAPEDIPAFTPPTAEPEQEAQDGEQ